MRKLRAFFYVYSKSLTSAHYYKEILETSGRFTLKYFLALSFILAVILTIKFSVVQIPVMQKAVKEVASTAKNLYEQDLVIKVENNVWSINKPEPYVVAFPLENTGNLQDEPDLPKNLITFYHEGTIEDLDRLETLMLLNAKNMLVQESKGFRAYPLEQLPNGELTKEEFDGFVDKAVNLGRNLPYVAVVFILVGTFLYFFVIRGSGIFILALFVWLFGNFTKAKPGYRNSVRVTAHASTLALTTFILAKVLDVSLPLAFWYEGLTFLFAVLVLVTLSKETGMGGEIDPKAAATSSQDKA